jgi:uncharacterized protein YceK
MRKIGLFLLVGALLAGCSSNPTNEPSDKEINDAVAKKMKAIDDDPSMTPEQKAELKKHVAGPVGGPGGSGKR